LAMAHQ